MSGSVLFQPYRSLGLVTSSVRPHLKLLGSERFLTVALGKSWCVYNLDRLRVVLMGPAREAVIKSIVSMRDLTFTTCGHDIIVWRRQDEVYRIKHHNAAVYHLYLFGGLLISVDEQQLLAVWDVKSLTPATSVKSQLTRAVENGKQQSFVDQDGVDRGVGWKATPLSTIQFPTTSRITTLLHPSTYLNKLLVGFEEANGSTGGGGGGLELWNIKTKQRIYRFNSSEWSSEKHDPSKKLAATLGRDAASLSGHKRGLDAAPSSLGVSITALEQSPAVDVVAVGCNNGLIVLLNIQLDQILHVYVHAPPTSISSAATAGGGGVGASAPPASPITALSFRTDENASQLASACANSSTVAVWDLEKKQLKTLVRTGASGSMGVGDGTSMMGAASSGAFSTGVHDVTLHSIYFLPNEPLLLTVGTDNALRLHIFDQLDGSARLLKDRSGHSGPPSRIRFYPGERGVLDVLSAGADRSLRSFSLQKEEQSREWSQGNVEKTAKNYSVASASLKLTPIVDMASCTMRQREWPNVLTAHANDAAAYTWKWSTKALSQHKLLNTTPGAAASAVKKVAISACGNHGLVGLASGRIDQFNMQSGTYKTSFGANHLPQGGVMQQPKTLAEKNFHLQRKAKKEAAKAANAAAAAGLSTVPPTHGHTAAITGLALDGWNRTLISCSLDGFVLFWDFRRRTVLHRVDLGSPCSRMAFSMESDLVAVMTDDLVLHILDAHTSTTVRRFKHHTAPLTDLMFSPDAKWVLTSSMDCTVRVFDLISATLIDFLRFNKPVSSLTLSPKGEFLATTHVNNLGIYLWANKAYFGSAGLVGDAAMHQTSLVKKVSRNQAVQMEVKERQGGEGAEEEEEELQAEVYRTNIKQEGEEEMQVSSEDSEEDSEDEEDSDSDESMSADGGSKKRRHTSSTSSLLTTTHTPLLHLPAEDQFDLITYSATPKSTWHTLAHLQEIRARNQVQMPTKPVDNAPFFLTALASLSNQKDGASVQEKEKLADQFGVSATPSTSTSGAAAAPSVGHRTIKSGGLGLRSTFIDLCSSSKSSLVDIVATHPNQHPKVYLLQAYTPVTQYLQALTPSQIDAEINALGLDPTTEATEFRAVLEYLLAALESHKHFEFVQAVMNRFLKVHGSALANYPELLQLCATLSEVQQRVWGRLEEAFQANMALVAHLAQIQL